MTNELVTLSSQGRDLVPLQRATSTPAVRSAIIIVVPPRPQALVYATAGPQSSSAKRAAFWVLLAFLFGATAATLVARSTLPKEHWTRIALPAATLSEAGQANPHAGQPAGATPSHSVAAAQQPTSSGLTSLALTIPGATTEGMAAQDGFGTPAPISALPQARAAIARAIESGVAQEWASGELQGAAVAAPAQVAGDHVCRRVTVWSQVKGTPAGEASAMRYCLNARGDWVRVLNSAQLAPSEEAVESDADAGPVVVLTATGVR
jgi:hypothetical protein